MADRQHIFRSAVDPAAAPSETGHHWVNTSSGRTFISTGTSTVNDWKLVPEVEDAINDGITTKSPSENAVFDALANKANTSHTQLAATITDFNTAADVRVNSGIAAHVALTDPHTQYATDADLASGLAGKANTSHTHASTDITDFNSASDARVALGITAHNAAPDPHPQYATDTDLTAGLAGKANTVHTHVSTDITDFQEAVQDAVGGELLATASIQPTYNDGANTTKWDVLPAGVDHNSLQNFVANKHIDHTAVQTTTAANSGLAGGGDISTTRNLVLNVNNLPTLALPTDRLDNGDQFPVYDLSSTTNKNITARSLLIQRFSLIDQGYTDGDDFVKTATGSLNAVGAGTGNSTQLGTYGLDSVSHALGVSQSDTGTTATGRRLLGSDLSSLTTGLARLRFGARIALEQLSNGTDTFTSYIGFINNSGAGDHTAGAYFRYTHSVNSGKWEAVTAGGTASPTRTANDTGVTATNGYMIFEVEFNLAGTQAQYYINGNLVATITTNIPPTSILANTTFGYGWKIEKSVGTTQVNISTDWYYYEQARTSAR